MLLRLLAGAQQESLLGEAVQRERVERVRGD